MSYTVFTLINHAALASEDTALVPQHITLEIPDKIYQMRESLKGLSCMEGDVFSQEEVERFSVIIDCLTIALSVYPRA
ncbi:hypothetical protein [Thiomicrorhabdus aquaedulcis]|uniref:hypothetical protein n=1 Tax=Thiomicrorhabdus aquaedulcis TaxID=2211106 RepID=UPI000FDB1016|nr:hypothetical protein [Thiomicrorhabdus aquaedulcis]